MNEAHLTVGQRAEQPTGTCKNGHPRTAETTYITKAGKTQCRICHSLWAKQNRERAGVREVLRERTLQWKGRNRERFHKNAKRLRAKKHGFLNAWKAERGCRVCGEKEPCCLDVHHRNPKEKEAQIARAVQTWKLDRLMAELAKCEVLCRNCHAKLHAADRVV